MMTENRESSGTQSLKSKVMKNLLDDGKAKGYLTLDDIRPTEKKKQHQTKKASANVQERQTNIKSEL